MPVESLNPNENLPSGPGSSSPEISRSRQETVQTDLAAPRLWPE